jgi:hypothetical protein
VLQETRRAGEQLISLDALQLLEWELHGAAVCALQKMCSTPTSAAAGGEMSEAPCTVSEKGVLQLLFDQRLLADVLAGGRPVAVSAGADTSLGAASGLPPGSGSGLTVAGGAGGLGSSLVQDVAGALASRKSQLTSLEQQLQVRRAFLAVQLCCMVWLQTSQWPASQLLGVVPCQ